MTTLYYAPLLLVLIFGCGKKEAVEEDDEASTEEAGSEDPASEDPGSESPGSQDPTPEDPVVSVEQSLITHFKFAASVDADTRAFILSDFKTLALWDSTPQTSQIAKLRTLINLTDINARSLSTWLQERVTYILPDDGSNFRFAYIVPQHQTVYGSFVSNSGNSGLAARNWGGILYNIYQNQHGNGADGLLFQFDDQLLPYRSPRTGIMQIGPNLFGADDSLSGDDEASVGHRMTKSLFRLNVIFHEARHSDGNTAAGNLSFEHAVCPSDGSVPPELAGEMACDGKWNGAYNVGRQVLDTLLNSCDSKCSEPDRAQLESIVIDLLSRVLVDDDPANYGSEDPQPELPSIDTSSYQYVP
jgi:hypothetical protein